jgi:hypothetical protein
MVRIHPGPRQFVKQVVLSGCPGLGAVLERTFE